MSGSGTQGPARFAVDPWDPGYGLAFNEDASGDSPTLAASNAGLGLDVETPAGQWAPVGPDPATEIPATLLFCDGVRRVDARVWVHGPDPQPTPGIAASFAAGLVRCDDAGASVVKVAVERALFTASPHATDIVTRGGRYPVHVASGGTPDELSLALQQRLGEAEVAISNDWRATSRAVTEAVTGEAVTEEDDLLVVDGPLFGRATLPRTVGYVKTHHRQYLPPPQAAVVAALAPCQRSPVFVTGSNWVRYAWYLRLPGGSGAPWSGVARLECSPQLAVAEAVALASVTARVLPRLASVPYKDPRAPQNLVPIGGLERELRHRLGDPRLLYRALCAAAV